MLGLTLDQVGSFWLYLGMPEARNGAAMREAYENLGMTRQDFALRVSVSPQRVTNIANGGPCSRSVAVRIANELGWSGPDTLFVGPEAVEAGEAAEGAEATGETTGETTAAEPEAEASVRGVA